LEKDASIVSLDHIRQFNKDGFTILDSNLSNEFRGIRHACMQAFFEIAKLHGVKGQQNDQFIIELYAGKHRDLWVAAYDQLRYLPEVMGICNNPSLINLAHSLGLKTLSQCLYPFPRVDMPNDSKNNFFKHQDYSYNFSSFNCITVWIPLQDVEGDIGPLTVIPGSHLNGIQPHNKDGYLLNYDMGRTIQVPMKVGQILVFSQLLHHESGYNTSDKVRCSIQVRYSDLSNQEYAHRKYYMNKKTVVDKPSIELDARFEPVPVSTSPNRRHR